MPVSSSRPKRKSRGDTYPEDNGGRGGGVGAGGVGLVGGGKDGGALEKENNAPPAKSRKKKREDGAEKPPSKVGAHRSVTLRDFFPISNFSTAQGTNFLNHKIPKETRARKS